LVRQNAAGTEREGIENWGCERGSKKGRGHHSKRILLRSGGPCLLVQEKNAKIMRAETREESKAGGKQARWEKVKTAM